MNLVNFEVGNNSSIDSLIKILEQYKEQGFNNVINTGPFGGHEFSISLSKKPYNYYFRYYIYIRAPYSQDDPIFNNPDIFKTEGFEYGEYYCYASKEIEIKIDSVYFENYRDGELSLNIKAQPVNEKDLPEWYLKHPDFIGLFQDDFEYLTLDRIDFTREKE